MRVDRKDGNYFDKERAMSMATVGTADGGCQTDAQCCSELAEKLYGGDDLLGLPRKSWLVNALSQR